MIELMPETKGNLIAIRMSGTVTEADQDACFDKVDAILSRERVEHMLLDWSQLDGWAKGARSTGTWFGMHHRALVGRVAILADEKWADETLRITDIFNAASVKRFPPSERQAAFGWICED
jgi:hypothetical protein